MVNKFNFEVLSTEDIKKIHTQSLRILWDLGIKIPNNEILTIMKKNGAVVDFKNHIVKLPVNLVEQTLKKVIENQEKYYNKINSETTKVKGWMFYNNSGDIVDIKDYSKRPVSLSDMLKAITLGNNLEFTEKISHFVEPKKYEGYTDIIIFYLLYIYSRKRNLLSANIIHSVNSARCILEMAKVIAEDDMQLRDGSILEYELLFTNNLEYSKEPLEIVYELAKNKIRIMICHWCWMGYHTPLTFASALSLSNANMLGGITIVMMLNPDQLFFDYIMDIFPINMHYKDFPSFGSPSQTILAMAGKQFADFYGFKKCYTNVGLTDAVENNFQSGFERGVRLALAAAGGADPIGLQGMIGPNQGVSFNQLIVDNEYLKYINYIFNKKISVNEGTLSFRKIREKGVGNIFLEDLESDKILKENHWESEIFNYKNYNDFEIDESYKKINLKIENILKNNYPPKPVISKDKIKKLDKILENYIKNKNILEYFRDELNKCFFIKNYINY